MSEYDTTFITCEKRIPLTIIFVFLFLKVPNIYCWKISKYKKHSIWNRLWIETDLIELKLI